MIVSRLRLFPGSGTFVPAFGVSFALMLSGCAVSHEISLEQMKVSGQVSEIPVKVTDQQIEGGIRISPKIALQQRQNIEGRVELNEPSPRSGTPPSAGNNFTWDLPSAVGGLDVDLPLGSHSALALGVDVASLRGRSFVGWTIGLGFFKEDSTAGGRIDLGIHSSPIAYEASTVITQRDLFSGTETRRAAYKDVGKGDRIGFYGAITLNTRSEAWPFNFFLNLALFKQALVNYTPSVVVSSDAALVQDLRASCSQWMGAAAPGVFLRLTDTMRLLVGSRFIWPLEVSDVHPATLILPFAQIDFSL
jgi:hypothetical protein